MGVGAAMTCPLFVELCAGTAALSLRLHHPRARPPVSRMGAKTGYADVILRCLGLRPGGQADRYLWCEPDAGVRLLLHAYTDRALAMAAADIIRSWKDEEPRALWERLRAEGPAVCPPVDAREVARWLTRHALTGLSGGYDSAAERTARGERWGGDVRDFVPRRLDQTPTLPATIADDARAVDPREVARWLCLHDMSLNSKGPAAGLGAIKTPVGTAAWSRHARGLPVEWKRCTGPAVLPARMEERLPLPLPATIADDARTVPTPPRLPAGTVAYADVPYRGTTGYAHAFPRAEWLPVVRRWKDAGALVCVSEAEPIPDLMAEGWHAVRIDGERRGQKRTFSKQQAEWLTMSERPRWRPSVQQQLFGGGR